MSVTGVSGVINATSKARFFGKTAFLWLQVDVGLPRLAESAAESLSIRVRVNLRGPEK